jgi:sugar lactone lactonase YvrE
VQIAPEPDPQVLWVTTLAGLAGNYGSADGTGGNAQFWLPYGVAVDSSGNIYVADTWNQAIRKVTPGGAVSTLAGNPSHVNDLGYPTGGYSDGASTNALFSGPVAVTVDAQGNVYVADTGNQAIRKVTPAGVVSTWAGNPFITNQYGTPVGGYVDAVGTNAQFNVPLGIAADSSGNLYVADEFNNVVRKITPAGVVSTLAGSGNWGSADGAGTNAQFQGPIAVAVDTIGNAYLSDYDSHTIRKITPSGVVSTLAGLAGYGGSADGLGSNARFGTPGGIAVDAEGNVYVSDTSNYTIRKITPTGSVSTLAGRVGSYGSVDGPGTSARFSFWDRVGAGGLAVDGSDILYVVDTSNHTIRKGVIGPSILVPPQIVPDSAGSNVTFSITVAGTGPFGYQWQVNGTNILGATNLTLTLSNVTASNSGDYSLVVSNAYGVAASVAATLTVPVAQTFTYLWTTLAGTPGGPGHADGVGTSARFSQPSGVALDGVGNLYVADTLNNTLREITPTGVVTTLAGTPGLSGSADGFLGNALLNGPNSIAFDTSSNLFIADTANQTIRKITPAGVVTTLAGLAGQAGANDGSGSNARFYGPMGIAVDAADNVYVADAWNSTIRKIIPNGTVTTLAGQVGVRSSADGMGTNALFYCPLGISVDSGTNLYVADTWNSTIRKITPAGVVSTIAGFPVNYGSSDGVGTNASFAWPTDVKPDNAGNLYVTDQWNSRIRKITPAGVVSTLAGLTGSGTDDGAGSSARFYHPRSLALDGQSNLYVVDTGNSTVRKITPEGVVSTFAGMGGTSWQYGRCWHQCAL